MARRCTVCIHPDRPAIDQMMINLRPYRSIMDRFALSKGALIRHHDDHLADALAKAKAAEETVQADDLLKQLEAIRTKAIGLMLKAEQGGDIRTALAGVREVRACLELLLEVERRIDRRPIVNIWLTTEWLAIEHVLTEVLVNYPDASYAVSARLNALRTLT